MKGHCKATIVIRISTNHLNFQLPGTVNVFFKNLTATMKDKYYFRNGTNKTDNVCRCDYTRGYDFIVRPKHRCVCLPSVEDCSCYLKNCSYNEMLSQGM